MHFDTTKIDLENYLSRRDKTFIINRQLLNLRCRRHRIRFSDSQIPNAWLKKTQLISVSIVVRNYYFEYFLQSD